MFERKELASLVLIIAISFIISFFIASSLISTPEDRSETVLDVEEFSETFPSPDPRAFNENAINPTEDISIGETFTPNPFRRGEQEDQ